jgi:hypothetical protein
MSTCGTGRVTLVGPTNRSLCDFSGFATASASRVDAGTSAGDRGDLGRRPIRLSEQWQLPCQPVSGHASTDESRNEAPNGWRRGSKTAVESPREMNERHSRVDLQLPEDVPKMGVHGMR